MTFRTSVSETDGEQMDRTKGREKGRVRREDGGLALM